MKADITIGDRAPGFSLPDSSGELVQMDDILQERSLIVVFYRGFW